MTGPLHTLALAAALFAMAACGGKDSRAADPGERASAPTTETRPTGEGKTKMKTIAELLKIAEEHFEDNRPRLDLTRVSFDDALLFDAKGEVLPLDSATPGPFLVVFGVPGGRRKGPRAARPAVVLDAASGHVYDRDPKGFEAFLAAMGWPARRDALSAEQLLRMWVAFSLGKQGRVVSETSRSNPRIKLVVSAPRLEVASDGAATLTGWTAAQRDMDLQRHTVHIDADGKLGSYAVEDVEDVVDLGGGGPE